MSKREHTWHFVKQFVGAGKPKLMQQFVPSSDPEEAPTMKFWLDARQNYAEFICDCGQIKTVLSQRLPQTGGTDE